METAEELYENARAVYLEACRKELQKGKGDTADLSLLVHYILKKYEFRASIEKRQDEESGKPIFYMRWIGGDDPDQDCPHFDKAREEIGEWIFYFYGIQTNIEISGNEGRGVYVSNTVLEQQSESHDRDSVEEALAELVDKEYDEYGEYYEYDKLYESLHVTIDDVDRPMDK